MKFDLKTFLKSLKLNESNISLILGAIVVIVTGIFVVNYFKDKGGKLPGGANNKTEIQETSFAKTHTVTEGENLWKIAEAEIGSGYNWVDIANENNLKNPGLIYEGQKLTIPSVEANQITKIQQPATELSSISGATYQVVKGDNLWNIAIRAYGDGFKWIEIAKENNLKNPNIIHPGNILALPR